MISLTRHCQSSPLRHCEHSEAIQVQAQNKTMKPGLPRCARNDKEGYARNDKTSTFIQK